MEWSNYKFGDGSMEHNALKEIIENDHDLYEIVKGCPHEIVKHFKVQEYHAGTVICNQGETIDSVFIVINGSAEIYYMAENGNHYSQAIIEKGQFIGEFEVFNQKPFVCTAEALTDLVLLQINYHDFIEWLKIDSNICIYLINYLCNRSYHFSKKAATDTLYSLKTRLCRYLLSRSGQKLTNTQEIKIQLNKEKLSNEFAVTVRSINRTLQDLKSKKIIAIESDEIIIKDLQKLIHEEKISRYE